MYLNNKDRPKLGKKMDDYLRSNIEDEEIFWNIWATMGIPDGASKEDYEDLKDSDEYNQELIDREDKPVTLENIPEVGEIGDFDLEDIDDVIANLEDISGFVCRNGNEIYELIA